ncbi:MAG: aspartyl/glutamyl-tRNA amidotransferase subunit A [Nitrospirae bacterium]|nr:aspartyl/glutamyl-tRNA amidotransferase subunit A [Nitrospirota bacterium]
MKPTVLEELTIAETSRRIRKKEISPVELTRLYLERIEALNPSLNAYLTLMNDQAMAAARRAEREIRRGKYRGRLHGIPFSIKDNLAIKGVRTTAGSKILSEWVPDFDATVVARLTESGAVILGKTQMHEWARGSHGINPFYGTTHNPWDLKRVPGGSSGGSAVAVAASLCMASIGTDSAGSVRNPSSFCGVVGLKPTYGRVSTYGGVPGTGGHSTNHFGVLTKTVEDCALVLETIAGYDPKDSLSAEAPVPRYSRAVGKGIRGMKVGLLRGYFDEAVEDEVRSALDEAVKTFQSLKMKVTEVSIPHLDLVPAVQMASSRSESTTDHDVYLRTRPRDYSSGLLYGNIAGLLIPAKVFIQAQRVRRLICQEFEQALEKVDVIIAPTVPVPAPTIEECTKGYLERDGRRIPLLDKRGNYLMLSTIPFNVTGLPSMSVPCGFSALGLPIGMQIVGGLFREETVIQVAHSYERKAGWYKRRPPL